ncbi:hypothetical protein RFI_24059, partial [Reticulomyxa filosa]
MFVVRVIDLLEKNKEGSFEISIAFFFGKNHRGREEKIKILWSEKKNGRRFEILSIFFFFFPQSQFEKDKKVDGGLKIKVFVDEGKEEKKEKCTSKILEFSTRDPQQLTYDELREKIISEFKPSIPGILDDNYSVNVKWKVVSFKDAAELLEDTSRDIDINDDDTLKQEFEDAESDNESDQSNQSDQSSQSDKKNLKLLIKRFGK